MDFPNKDLRRFEWIDGKWVSVSQNQVLQPLKEGRGGQETETPMSTRVCLGRTPIGTPTDVELQKKPTMDFPNKDLRRFEWIDGKWVSVSQNQQTMKPRYNVGASVEVCLPDKLYRGAWFPATVLKELENGLFWVQYNFLRLGNNEECSKDIVDANQVRPSPPQDRNGRNFVVLEEVDVFFDFAWWEGIVTEVLAGNQYNISLKHEKKQRQFNQSELRSHMIWVNGKWDQNIEDKIAECHQGGIAGNKPNTRKRKIKHGSCEPCKNLMKGGTSEDPMYTTPITEMTEVVQTECTSEKTEMIAAKSLSNIEDLQCLSMCSEELYAPAMKDKQDIQQQRGEIEKETTIILERREQSKEMVSKASAEGVSPDYELASQSNMTFTSREPLAKGSEVQISMSLEEDKDSGDNAVEDEKETTTPGFLFFNNIDEVTMENQNLPFNKRSSVWEELEAMEIFRSIPQHPHFRPLEQLCEFLREGQAIGYMLSYAELADKASKAQVDEPRITLERKLNALVRLELLGFYVQPIRARLEELLRVKDCRVKLAADLKQVEDKIMKETNEKESLESELQKSDKKIKDLQEFIIQLTEKRQMSFMEKQRKGLGITELQQKVSQIEEEIHRTKLQFDHAAAAPW